MNVAVAHELFKAGDLVKARIEPLPVNKGFSLVLVRRSGELVSVCKARSKDAKVYKRELAAKQDAVRIGFKEVSLLLN